MSKFKIESGMVWQEAVAQRDSGCRHCPEVIPGDADCIWVQDHGMFHKDCVELPARVAPPMAAELKAKAREMRDMFTAEAQVALVRCDAGRTYSRSKDTIKGLREHGLIERNAWRVTSLGAALVEELCR